MAPELFALLVLILIIGLVCCGLFLFEQGRQPNATHHGRPAYRPRSESRSHRQDSRSRLRSFVQTTIIPNFSEQRIRGDQFAALILLDCQDLKDITSTILSPQYPMVDCDNPYYPHPHSPQQQNNYLVARPDKKWYGYRTTHAEVILIDNFDSLWRAYFQSHSGREPQHILLYSWIMPCKYCTKRICSLQPLSCKKTVVYTIDCRKGEDRDQMQTEENTETLNRAGVKVYQVGYPDELPPVTWQ